MTAFLRFVFAIIIIGSLVNGCSPIPSRADLAAQVAALEGDVDDLRLALRRANEEIEQTASDLESQPRCQIELPEPVDEP